MTPSEEQKAWKRHEAHIDYCADLMIKDPKSIAYLWWKLNKPTGWMKLEFREDYAVDAWIITLSCDGKGKPLVTIKVFVLGNVTPVTALQVRPGQNPWAIGRSPRIIPGAVKTIAQDCVDGITAAMGV